MLEILLAVCSGGAFPECLRQWIPREEIAIPTACEVDSRLDVALWSQLHPGVAYLALCRATGKVTGA